MAKTESGATAATDKEIADRINAELKSKKFPVTTLSEQTGISDKTLRRSLSGGRSLTFAEFEKIAAALNVNPSTLLPETFAA